MDINDVSNQQYHIPTTPWINFRKGLQQTVQRKFSRYRGRDCFARTVYGVFPIVDWLVHYNVKKWLPGDLISGFTVGVMSIPQGMAYGVLSAVDPVQGLYASFFPVIFYSIFCTSQHASVGTFAATSMMTSKIVRSVGAEIFAQRRNASSSMNLDRNQSASGEERFDDGIPIEVRVEVMMAVTLSVGIWLVIMGILRLGHLAVFLSDYLVKGFTCAVAVHICTAQVKLVFGMPQIPERYGPFKIIYFYADVFSHISDVHIATLVVTLICLTFMYLVRVLVNQSPKIIKVIRVPVPSELLVIIFATVASYYLDLESSWGVKSISSIPAFFPAPQAPTISLIPTMLGRTFNLAIVAAAVLLVLAKIYAKKHRYKIDTNQELIALGFANIFGAFFFCIPATGALARSVVQDAVGGKTQIVSIMSAMIVLFVLVALGRFMEPLPRACLGAIIIMAMLNMLKQITEVRRLWHVSLIDMSIFLVTLIATLFLDLDLGLAVSISYSLLTFAFRMQYGRVVALGRVRGSADELRPLDDPMVDEITGTKVYRLYGPLYSGNAETFTLKIYREIANNEVTLDSSVVDKLLEPATNVPEELTDPEDVELNVMVNGGRTQAAPASHAIRVVIIDFSSVNFVDIVGAESMISLAKECKRNNVELLFAGCVDSVRDVLILTGILDHLAPSTFIRNVADAISKNEKNILNAWGHSFGESATDYCAPVWSPACDKLRSAVEIIQRKSLRTIGDLPPYASVDQKFEDWNIEAAENRWRRQDATWLYRIINSERNPMPDYMDLINFRQSPYALRRPERIEFKCKTIMGDRQLSRRLRSLFNTLLPDVW